VPRLDIEQYQYIVEITYHLVVDFVAAPMEADIETLFQLIDFDKQSEPSLSI
jgi:hypothetical protein